MPWAAQYARNVPPTREYTHAGATLVVERQRSDAGEHVTSGPIILLHGIGMGRSVYADLVEHLDDTADVIAVDLPGYGEAPEPDRVLTMERTADLVAAYVEDALGAPAVIVGHSMGAQVAIEVGARHPSLTDRLVLLGPSGDPTTRSAPAVVSRLVRDLAFENPKVIALGAREYVRAGPKLPTKLRAMLAHRPERVLSRVAAPTLVIRGADDKVTTRRWCDTIAEGVQDGRVAEIAGHGHETMIRDAAPAADLIRAFLAGPV
jgi:pimeloyl-ACP methyl ester carboxylesterase